MTTVSEALLDALVTAGVHDLFGVVGDAINPLVDAVRRDDRIRWVHVRHEETGAFAASAQAKLTGGLAACAGTVGPGAIHLLNGLYDAAKDHAPVLAITGQVPRAEVGSNFHQEVDLQALFADVAVFNETIMTTDQAPRLIAAAIATAVGRRGVAHLTLPADLGAATIDNHPAWEVTPQATSVPHVDALADAAAAIDRADRITILAGTGCRDGVDELLALAGRLQAPIVHALRGKDLVDADHPSWVGGLGLLGSRPGVHAVEHADLLLMVGTDFPYREWYPDDVTTIQVDREPAHIGRRTGVAHALVGDAGPTMAALTDLVAARTNTSHIDATNDVRRLWERFLEHQASPDRGGGLHPQQVAAAISRHAAPDAVFSVDTGEVTVWAARHLHMKRGQRFLLSFNLASMAFAMPGAIGAQLLDPDRQVIALAGDGGLTMLLGDLLSVVAHDLPITIVVFDNHKLGLVSMEMAAAGLVEYGVELDNPDLAAVARAIGLHARRVESPGELDDAIADALAHPGPSLVDAVVVGDELTVPPAIPVDKAIGFGLSTLKEWWMSVGGNPDDTGAG